MGPMQKDRKTVVTIKFPEGYLKHMKLAKETHTDNRKQQNNKMNNKN